MAGVGPKSYDDTARVGDNLSARRSA